MAAAATIEVSRCRQIATVIAATANIIRQARPIPLKSAAPAAPLTMMATPPSAARLASKVRNRAGSRNQIQASAAAANGCAAIMIATFATLVSCKAGINVTMASVENASDKPSVGSHRGQFAQTRPALRENQERGDEAAAKQAAPE